MNHGDGGVPPWQPPPAHGPPPYGMMASVPGPAPVAGPHRSPLGVAGVHAMHHAPPPPGYPTPTYAPAPYPTPPSGGMIPPPSPAYGGHYGPWPGPTVPPVPAPPMAPFPGPPPNRGAASDPKLEAMRQRRMMMRQQRRKALEAAQSMVMQATQRQQMQQAVMRQQATTSQLAPPPTQDFGAVLTSVQQQQQQMQAILTSLASGAPLPDHMASGAAAPAPPTQAGGSPLPAFAAAQGAAQRLKARAAPAITPSPVPGTAPRPDAAITASKPGSTVSSAGQAASQSHQARAHARAQAPVVRTEVGLEDIEGLDSLDFDRLLAEDERLTKGVGEGEGDAGSGGEDLSGSDDEDYGEGEGEGKAGGEQGGRKADETAARARHRATIEQRLRLSRMKQQDRKPRWRFEAAGEPVPPDEDLLRGVALFRAVALVVRFIVSVSRQVHAMRVRLRWRELVDMHQLMVRYFDFTRSWLARTVSVPVSSILKDSTLDFETRKDVIAAQRGYSIFRRGEAIERRALKLRVRVKGVIDELTHAVQSPDGVPAHLLKFLRNLTSDGTYLPADYLWPSETGVMAFTKYGAIRKVDRPARPEGKEEDGDGSGVTTASDPEGDIRAAANGATVPTRREVLLANFIIARILVPHVLLRPWDAKRKPKRKTMHNCRIFATLVYRLLRRCITGQPPGRTTEPAVSAGQAPAAGGSFAGGSMFALGPGGADSTANARVPTDPLEAPVRHTLVGPPFVEGTTMPLPRPLRPIGESAAEYYRLYGVPSQYQHRPLAALRRAASVSATRTLHGVAVAAQSRQAGGQASNAAAGGGEAEGAEERKGKGGIIGRALAGRRGRRGSDAGAQQGAGGDSQHDRGNTLQAAASALKHARRGGTIVAGRRRGSTAGDDDEDGDDAFSNASGEDGSQHGEGGREGEHHQEGAMNFGAAAAVRIRAGHAAGTVREAVADHGQGGEHAESDRKQGAGALPTPPEQREFMELDSSFMTEEEVCGLLLGDADQLEDEEEMAQRMNDLIVDICDLVREVED